MATCFPRVAAFAAALPGASLGPTLAFAHTGVGDIHGFIHDFLHPVTRPDDVLAMVAVGLLAWQLGGRALWAVPAASVGGMAVDGVFGVMGIKVPFVEFGIALSIVVLRPAGVGLVSGSL